MMKFVVFCVVAQVLCIHGKSVSQSNGNKNFPTPTLEESRNFAKYIKFHCWTSPEHSFNSPLNDDLVENGCPANAKLTFIFPGYNTDYSSEKCSVLTTVRNFLKYRGGCVCVMDYRSFTLNPNFLFSTTTDYVPITEVAVKKLMKVGNPGRIMFYGHSIGSRIAVGAGITLEGKIERLDLCELAGGGFDENEDLDWDPTTAGGNVQCLHTTSAIGTTIFKCDQNWRIGGACGFGQTWDVTSSSHYCNDIYNAAFTHSFKPKECVLNGGCYSKRAVNILSPDCHGASLGFFRKYNFKKCRGDIFTESIDVKRHTNV